MIGMSTEQQIRCAIGCAWLVTDNLKWRAWARAWVNGTDRTPMAAEMASDAVAYGEEVMAAGAARASARAAAWAVWGSNTEWTVEAVDAAAEAWLSADAWAAAGVAAKPLPFDKVAQWVMSGAGLDELDLIIDEGSR